MKKPLILWGGTDIGTHLYNEEPSSFTEKPDVPRDINEELLVKEAIKKGQPIIGICRGSQLLCALNGGKLWQHSKTKQQSHSIVVVKDGHLISMCPADHHQIMIPKGDFEILAYSPHTSYIWDEEQQTYFEVIDTPEVVWFPKTKCLAIQPHPEWTTKEHPFVQWINKVIQELDINYEFK